MKSVSSAPAVFALVLLAVSAAASAQTAAPAKAKALDPANFDSSVKPCDDFYQYANGAWLKSHSIPADRARYGSFDEVSDRNRDILKKILEESAEGAPMRRAEAERLSIW